MALRFLNSGYFAGKVGIGTETPASTLQINGAPLATSGALVTVRNTAAASDNTSFGGIFFNSSPGVDFSIGKSNINEVTTLSFRNGSSGASLLDITPTGDATFAGTIIATENGGDASIYINNSRPSLAFTDSNSYTDANDKYIVRGTGSDRLQFQWYDDSASTTTETFHITSSGNATFAGNVLAGTGDIAMDASSSGQLEIQGNGYRGAIALDATAMRIYHNSSSRDLVLGTNETARLTIKGSTGNATFTGTVTSPTFLGDLNGTINTATTGTTQTAGNNSTKIATTAYADAAAGAVPIGNYLPLAGGTMTGNIDFGDSVRARFGDGDDLQIVFDGSNSYIHNVDNGDLYIRQTADDKSIIFECDDGSGGYTPYLRLNGSSTDAYFTNPGKVGIGTTSPIAKLQVNNEGLGEFAGANSSAGGISHLMLRDEGGTARTLMSGPSVVFQTPANADGTNIWATSRLLGSPAAAGSARGTFSIQVRDQYDPFSNGTSWNWRTCLTAINTGSVGIGTTTPASKLDVRGEGRFKDKLLINGVDFDYASLESTAGHIISRVDTQDGLFDYGNSALHIESGKVGIGTNNPGTKLDVYGTIKSNTNGNRSKGNINIGLTTNNSVKWSSITGTQYAHDTEGEGFSIINGLGTSTYNAVYIGGALNEQNAATEIGFYTASDAVTRTGSIKMRIIANGNVGIGVTSPGEKLHVDGNIRLGNSASLLWGSNNLTLKTASSSTIGVFTLAPNSAGTVYAPRFQMLNASSATGVLIRTDGDSFFNGGNVGIGTTTPGAKLHVDGTAIFDTDTGSQPFYITRSGNANQSLKIYTDDVASYFTTIQDETTGTYGSMIFILDDGAPSPVYSFQYGSSSLLRLQANGNVGIGNTNPDTKLEISGSSSTTYPKIKISNPSQTGRYMSIGMIDSINHCIEANGGSTYLTFRTAGTQKMVIETGGNVGIGVTNPSNQLHVHTATDNTYAIRIEGSTDNGANVWTGLGIGGEANNTKSALLFQDIGVSYARGKLHLCVNNELNQNNATPADAKLTVSNDGNVGIGDTTPGYKLDVTGTIRATGDVIAFSDARVKDNVVTIDNALDKVNRLRGVTYTRNDIEDKQTKMGVIAQEVLEVIPEVVQQDDKGNYSVAYGNMNGLLIEAIKELKAEIEELKSRL